MKRTIDPTMLIDYLDGACSDDRRRLVEAWLGSDPAHRAEFERIRKIWETPGPGLPKPDVEAALRNVVERAGIGTQAERPAPVRHVRFKPPLRARFPGSAAWTPILRAAAILLILAGASYTVVRTFIMPPMKTLVVENGRQERITLPDGSEVTLDAGSTFRYPRKSGPERRVILRGEGYFRVQQDGKPFVVEANEAVVTVLGTQFNVRAWEETKRIVVAVASGSVFLKSKEAPPETGVVLAAGQASRMEEHGIPAPAEQADLDAHLSWLRREKYFQDTPAAEVLDQIGRWYDLEFQLPDDFSAMNRVTIHIQNKPVEDILALFALVNNFTYQRDRNRVAFTPIE